MAESPEIIWIYGKSKRGPQELMSQQSLILEGGDNIEIMYMDENFSIGGL